VRGENKGKVHPGADDNASGVALLIELAGELRRNPEPDRSIVLLHLPEKKPGSGGLHTMWLIKNIILWIGVSGC